MDIREDAGVESKASVLTIWDSGVYLKAWSFQRKVGYAVLLPELKKGTKSRLDLKHFFRQDNHCSLPRRSQLGVFPPLKKKAYGRVQDLPWHRGCHQVILCQRENISSRSCFTVGYCWGGHESVICWLSYKAVLEIDDVYVITSELIGSPQASVELSRSEWVNEAIPHAIWGSIFFCGFFKYVKSIFKYFHFLCVGLCLIFVLFIIKAI